MQDFGEYNYLVENDFDELVGQRFNLAAKAKEIKSQLDRLNVEIATMLTVAGAQKVGCDGLTVSLIEGRITKKLDKLKLLELGVTAYIIEEATTESKGSPYIRVMESKKE